VLELLWNWMKNKVNIWLFCEIFNTEKRSEICQNNKN
jgi:hypothetical protein